ncbi:MAG: CRISPR-associated protein Cas4 [Chloroflexi bacterium]|nr:CRISPR-associated protein Cas4 [Chloroflexota bacterium]
MELPDGLTFGEEEVLISAIEHYSYCPRQCALIHVEQTFDDNVFTIRGHLAHERVHAEDDAVSHGVRVLRAVPLWSERLRLRGTADLIELRPDGPYPVEYKVGRRQADHPDLQLCAQALCLEEMLGVAVREGAVFYHAERRRHEVLFDDTLRERTMSIVARIREILVAQRLPPAPNDARCRRCSLIKVCLPHVVAEPARLRGLKGALFQPWEPRAGDMGGWS